MQIFILLCVAILHVVIVCVGSEKNNDCPKIKSKRQWEGTIANKFVTQPMPVEYVIIHHTVSNKCESFAECAVVLQNIQSYHILTREFDDIGYNFMIGNDGLVYEGRGWNKVGNHTKGYNRNGIGIAFIGDFTSKRPTQVAFDALKHLLRCGVKLGMLSPDYKLLAARQVSSTISPGLPIFGEIQEWDNWTENNKMS